MKNGNKERERERKRGRETQHIFILKPAVCWACCSCSCRFLHAMPLKRHSEATLDQVTMAIMMTEVVFCLETTEAWLKREKCCQNAEKKQKKEEKKRANNTNLYAVNRFL